jgi:hypothetical protein
LNIDSESLSSNSKIDETDDYWKILKSKSSTKMPLFKSKLLIDGTTNGEYARYGQS